MTAWYNNLSDPGGPDWIRKGTIALDYFAEDGEQVQFADVDGNGRADYLAVSDDGTVRARFNTGCGIEDVT